MPRAAAYKHAAGLKGAAEYANVAGIIGVIVSRRLATLAELQTIYSYADALDLAEIIQVGNYNEWAAMEAAKNGSNR